MMNIHLVFAALICCVASTRMPFGYVMLNVTHKKGVNDDFQLQCNHNDCIEEKCLSLTIFKDSYPFVRKDYTTQDISVYPLPGSPFSLLYIQVLKTRIILEGKIVNQHAAGNFTCQVATESDTDSDWGEMSLVPCKNCTLEPQPPTNTLTPEVHTERTNRTVGADFEMYCDHISCRADDCIYLYVLKDDKPILRTQFGVENVNLYQPVGDQFGRIKLRRFDDITGVVIQVGNSRAGGKYSCEIVSLKGYYKESRYLNVIPTTNSILKPLVKSAAFEEKEKPGIDSTTANTLRSLNNTDTDDPTVRPSSNSVSFNSY